MVGTTGPAGTRNGAAGRPNGPGIGRRVARARTRHHSSQLTPRVPTSVRVYRRKGGPGRPIRTALGRCNYRSCHARSPDECSRDHLGDRPAQGGPATQSTHKSTRTPSPKDTVDSPAKSSNDGEVAPPATASVSANRTVAIYCRSGYHSGVTVVLAVMQIGKSKMTPPGPRPMTPPPREYGLGTGADPPTIKGMMGYPVEGWRHRAATTECLLPRTAYCVL